MNKKALLFLNGIGTNILSDFSEYQLIICTDGAYNRIRDFIPINIIIGDLDSIDHEKINPNIEIIYTPDQNKTDFEKAIEYLIENNFNAVDVYNASGLEQDHFLGNLSVAIGFKKSIDIIFFDDYGSFFVAKKNMVFNNKENKIISLFPMCKAKDVIFKGVEFELNSEILKIGKRIGIRNKILSKKAELSFNKGEIIIFLEN